MLNREINAHGLISFLWRQEWEVSQNITEARMEVLTDLIYIHLAFRESNSLECYGRANDSSE